MAVWITRATGTGSRASLQRYHVYAYDLRGHGNSAWAPGAMYSMAENVLDLAGLLDIIGSTHGRFPSAWWGIRWAV